MRKRSLLLCAVLLLAVAAAVGGAGASNANKGLSTDGTTLPNGNGRPDSAAPDAISIDALARFGVLEQAPALFRHDRHTEALAKRTGWDTTRCRTCHLPGQAPWPR